MVNVQKFTDTESLILANLNKEVIHALVILLESYTDRKVPCTIYLAEILPNNTSFENIDHVVLSEFFLSVYRHEKMLDNIVKYFYCSKKIRLQIDKSLLIVVTYILIFLLNKDTAAKDVRELMLSVISLSRALRLLEFYNEKNIINDLLKISCTYFDLDYVQNKVLKTILTDSKVYKDLLKDLHEIGKREEEERKQNYTVPITPNVLQHIKKAPPPGLNTPLPETSTVTTLPPPKSTYIKPDITVKLNEMRKKNKEASLRLYNEAQKNAKKHQTEAHHIKHKCRCSTPSVAVSKKAYRQSTKHYSKAELPVKVNAAFLLREAARIIQEEDVNIKKVEELTKGGANYGTFEKLMDEIRESEQTRHLQEIEKKHLQGLLTREEAILARQNLLLANKNKRIHFEEDRKKLKEELNQLKLVEEEKIKNTIEKTQQVQKNIEAKRKDLLTQKQNTVQEINETSRQLLEEAMKKRAEELSQRMDMIEEIRTLNQLKEFHGCQFDPSETMNFGLLCEMSLTELQERLLILQIDLKEELEKKQEKVKRQRFKQQQFLIDTQEFIDEFRSYKKEVATAHRRKNTNKTVPCNEEILSLRKKLESARKKKCILLAQTAG